MHPLLQRDGTRLLLGNEAVVRGALEAGIGAFSTYPGTPASEIGDTFAALCHEVGCHFEYAVNEKVAVETVIAFSLSGWRAMAAMKHVGLNVAADAFMTFPYLGVDGGAIIVSADDPGCHSSQNEQDNRHFARMAGVPMLEPANPEEAARLTKAAFEWSERLGLPVLLRLTTRVAHMRGPVAFHALPPHPVAARRFERDPFNRVVVPAVARRRHQEQVRRLAEAALAAENPDYFWFTPSSTESGLGIVATGAARGLIRDALQRLGLVGQVALFEFAWTWPHPTEALVTFLRPLRRVLVVEEGTPFQEDALAALAHRARLPVEVLGKATGHFLETGEYDPDLVEAAIRDLVSKGSSPPVPVRPAVAPEFPIPTRPPILCPGCPHRASYLLAKHIVGPETLIATDIGCYTLGLNPPIQMGDLLVCMGSSVSTGAALAAAQDRPVLAVIGDSTFFHGGIPALIHAVTQKRRLTLLVLDNRTTAMTGFQPHPGAYREGPGAQVHPGNSGPEARVLIESIARACGASLVETVDPYRPAETLQAIRRAWNSEGVAVVVARSPCPQMAERTRLLPRRPPVRVVRERCRTCGNTHAGRHCGLAEIAPYQAVRARTRLDLAPKDLWKWSQADPADARVPLDTPPCTAACPAQICVQGYVGLVAAGRFAEAYELVRRRIPLPAVCAYVCPHPCESVCVREHPVAIRHLKRMAVRFGFRPGIIQAGTDTGHRVAVIGSGPSGLTAVEYLRRRGHRVTLFEAADAPGGLLRYAIPRFRLPVEVVEREVGEILALGVDLKTGFRLGRDGTVSDLFHQGYEAVVLAIGLSRTVGIAVPGSDLRGIEDALLFLREAAWGQAPALDGDVVVIGGGNTAMDTARVALRSGARSVTVVYRRSEAEMPAFPEEVELARREGVNLIFQAIPVRFEGAEGRVSRTVFLRTSLGPPDSSGRPRPVPVPGSEFSLPSARVFLALGQAPCDLAALGLDDIATTPDGRPALDRDTMMTSRPGVFVCGDASGGPATVIDAIHSGQAVASSVDRFLTTGQPGVSSSCQAPPPPRSEAWRAVAFRPGEVPLLLDEQAWEGRDGIEDLSDDRLQAMARQEADRCLQCGTCANCRVCVEWTGCPALRWRDSGPDDPGGPEVIESLCNGCGLCALVCPNGAIVSSEN